MLGKNITWSLGLETRKWTVKELGGEIGGFWSVPSRPPFLLLSFRCPAVSLASWLSVSVFVKRGSPFLLSRLGTDLRR